MFFNYLFYCARLFLMGTSVLPFAPIQLPKAPSLLRASGLTSSPSSPSQAGCCGAVLQTCMGKCALSLTAVLFVLPHKMHKVLSCFSSSLSLIMECFLWAVSSWLTMLFTLSVLREGEAKAHSVAPRNAKGLGITAAT